MTHPDSDATGDIDAAWDDLEEPSSPARSAPASQAPDVGGLDDGWDLDDAAPAGPSPGGKPRGRGAVRPLTKKERRELERKQRRDAAQREAERKRSRKHARREQARKEAEQAALERRAAIERKRELEQAERRRELEHAERRRERARTEPKREQGQAELGRKRDSAERNSAQLARKQIESKPERSAAVPRAASAPRAAKFAAAAEQRRWVVGVLAALVLLFLIWSVFRR